MKKVIIIGLCLKSLFCPVLDGIGTLQNLTEYTGQEIYIDHGDHGHVVQIEGHYADYLQ